MRRIGPRKRRLQRPELALHIKCVAHFRETYPEFARLITYIDNNARSARAGAMKKKMGTTAGMPDLIFLLPRGEYNYACFEFKAPQGRLSSVQMAVHADIRQAGGKVILVTSFDYFTSALDAYLQSN